MLFLSVTTLQFSYIVDVHYANKYSILIHFIDFINVVHVCVLYVLIFMYFIVLMFYLNFPEQKTQVTFIWSPIVRCPSVFRIFSPIEFFPRNFDLISTKIGTMRIQGQRGFRFVQSFVYRTIENDVKVIVQLASACLLDIRKWRQSYCSVGSRSRAFALLNSPEMKCTVFLRGR